MYFNSIKVRLEHTLSGRGRRTTEQFQFHKGTIRTMCLSTKIISKKLFQFQFHKGTIRTQCFGNLSLKVSYFNSIKVRLERIKHWLILPLHHYFNSIKVRLERHAGNMIVTMVLYFNSIKVRLEHLFFLFS